MSVISQNVYNLIVDLTSEALSLKTGCQCNLAMDHSIFRERHRQRDRQGDSDRQRDRQGDSDRQTGRQ